MTSKRITRKDFLDHCRRGALGLALGALAGPASKAAPAPAASGAAREPNGLEGLPWRLAEVARWKPKAPGEFSGRERWSGLAWSAAHGWVIAGSRGVLLRAETAAPRLAEIPGPCCAIAAAPDGSLVAAARTRVMPLDGAGKPLPAWGAKGEEPGEFRFITGLAASDRFVYVCDAGARRVQRFAVNGDFIDVLDGYQIPAGNPLCCAPEVDPEDAARYHIPSGYFDCTLDAGTPGGGQLLVGHTGLHRVERYSEDGRMLTCWGKFGNDPADFCGCCNPTNLAVLADGRIATTEKGVPRLKLYSPEGMLLACVGPEHFPGNSAGMALAVDGAGRIGLLEPVEGLVRIYEARKA